MLLRRLRVPGVVVVLSRGSRWCGPSAWLNYPETFAAIFPTRETWDIAWADLGLVRDQFRDAVAPVEYVGGWALLAAIGTAFVVFTARHVRLPRPRPGARRSCPVAVLFVFVAALGADQPPDRV